MDMKTPIWVLLYLIDQEKWWPNEGPHEQRYFPDIHGNAFLTEKEAENHRSRMSDPSAYLIRKTYLQESI